MLVFDNIGLANVSDPVANHDSQVHVAPGHTSSRANRIIYLNSTQPHKYQNNKIRLRLSYRSIFSTDHHCCAVLLLIQLL